LERINSICSSDRPKFTVVSGFTAVFISGSGGVGVGRECGVQHNSTELSNLVFFDEERFIRYETPWNVDIHPALKDGDSY
jgi:hypothetical protein